MKSRGFTLIEILVVVVILAVMASVLTLAVNGVGGERRLAAQSEQMQALLGYACEQAELTDQTIGISIDTAGYRFSQLRGPDWFALPSAELRERKWLDGTTTAFSRDGQPIRIADKYPDKPQIACFASGELTPFRLELALADLTRIYRLDGSPDGAVKIAAIDARPH